MEFEYSVKECVLLAGSQEEFIELLFDKKYPYKKIISLLGEKSISGYIAFYNSDFMDKERNTWFKECLEKAKDKRHFIELLFEERYSYEKIKKLMGKKTFREYLKYYENRRGK